ncbi:2-isopropylmalate synthase [Cytobacillus firmus]|uniref:2-isopropylmalate synthase n=1 Tax=Cytobacillus firmus TaxID=1399 RepID=UPI002163B4DE|nr:2-isopropylmalate synthase [Cytobacillus firmus]MCS0671258.1 2-isopropylmalate synthase [Cytobacillus firmus]
MNKKIYTFDTTLRDGEQTPGVNLNQKEKVEIALQLEKLGIDIIEAGFAAASPGDLNAVRAVAKAVNEPIVVSLARTNKEDIDAVVKAFKGIKNVGIHIFIATSPIHMEKKLTLTEEQVIFKSIEAVRYARQFFDHIEFSFEDSTRSDINFLCFISEKVIEAGAKVLNYPDTVGYTTPWEYSERFKILKNRVEGIDKVILSCHCHNDLGMATVNSLAAIEAGVTQVEGCLNGIGERAGNAPLEEVALALETRYDYFRKRTTMNLKEIAKTSKLVSRLTAMPISATKPIIGDNAFAHESGIHQDGVLKDKETYEIMKPETVGLKESSLILGKLSGRHALRGKLAELGYSLSDEELSFVFKKFKDLADRKKQVLDEDIITLLDKEITNEIEYYKLKALYISYSTPEQPYASVQLHDKYELVQEEGAYGNGAVDAIFNAIDKIVDLNIELLDYKILSVTKGKDAQGEVYVQIKNEETVSQGRGISIDILEASAYAYIMAVNRIKNKIEQNVTL